MEERMLEARRKVERIIEAAKRVVLAKDDSPGNRTALQRLDDIFMGQGCDGTCHEDQLVVCGNWNEVRRYDPNTMESEVVDNTLCRVGSILWRMEDEVIATEWGDVMTFCDCCGKLYRYQGNSYSWLPKYFNDICQRCWQKRPKKYLSLIEGDPQKAVTLDIYPEDHGYVRVEKQFVRGLHPGQKDHPEVVAETLEDAGISRYLFYFDSKGQFDLRFSVYVHESEADRVPKLTRENTETRVSPAMMAKKAMNAISDVSPEPGKVSYVEVDTEKGTSKVHQISKQDFIEKGIEGALDKEDA